jgi:hypothetical protein
MEVRLTLRQAPGNTRGLGFRNRLPSVTAGTPAQAGPRPGPYSRYNLAAFSPRILRCTSGVSSDIFSATVSSGLG